MISNNKARRILGDEYSHLTDEEIQKLTEQLYSVTYDMFEIWKKDKLRGKDKKV